MQSVTHQNLNFFLSKQNTDLSFSHTIKSDKLGKKVVIIGTIHGNEPVGIDAMINLINSIQNKQTQLYSGEITFVIGNPIAYLSNARFINKNLNREFKETQHPINYEQYRANEIIDFLKKYDPDFVLDLHSVSVGDEQMEIYDKDSKIPKKLINQSVLQIILDKNVIAGGLCQLSFLKSTMSMECGNHNSKYGLERALNKIENVLDYYKIINKLSVQATLDNPIVNPIASKYQFIEAIKPKHGFRFTDPKICSEYFLQKDQVYCTYLDETNQTIQVKTNQDCYVLMPNLNPNLEDSDAGFLATKL